MARTFNRRPIYTSTNDNNYTKSKFFTHAEFKGICDSKNDVLVDQLTFSDAKNIYIDEANVLTSRPPFKFYDGEAFVVNEWLFGSYNLRLYRIVTTIYHTGNYWPYLIAPVGWTTGDAWPTGQDVLGVNYGLIPRGWSTGKPWPYEAPPLDGTEYKVNDISKYDVSDLSYMFIIKCISHLTVSDSVNIFHNYSWKIPMYKLDANYLPKVTCAQIEDKIFIWFAGIDFIAFNTSGKIFNGINYLYFEDATKYIYTPIHKLVSNGIETNLEDKNFLTEKYVKRHQYSTISEVNFNKLIGRHMKVYLNDGTSKHLYDIDVVDYQDKMLVYPYSPIGSNYFVDIVQTPRSTVTLRYGAAFHSIEISFDGKSYRALPVVENIVGTPLLTKDGLWVIAFTSKGLAKCKLVAQEEADLEEFNYSWVIDPYMRNSIINSLPAYTNQLDTSFVPTGYFETIDNFAYVFKSNDIQYLYTEWLAGTNNIAVGCQSELALSTDDIKVHFKYVTPVENYLDLGAVISIMISGNIKIFFFKQNFTTKVLQNDDELLLTELLGNTTGVTISNYVYRLTPDGTEPVNNSSILQSGDLIILSGQPLYTEGGPSIAVYTNFQVNGQNCHMYITWKMYYMLYNTNRCIIRRVVGEEGPIYLTDKVYLTSLDKDVVYDVETLKKVFGTIPTVYNVLDEVVSVADWFTSFIVKKGSSYINVGSVFISGFGNTAYIDRTKNIPISENGYGLPCNQLDIYMNSPTIDISNITYECILAYKEQSGINYFTKLVYKYLTDVTTLEDKTVIPDAKWFRIMSNTDIVITDKYMYIDNTIVDLPQKGTLIVEDNERSIVSNDEILITLESSYSRNIHKLTSDGKQLASGPIKSGDLVSYTLNAITDKDYLQPCAFDIQDTLPVGIESNRFYIEKLDENDLSVISGVYIRSGDLIRLRAFEGEITLSIGNPGNPYNEALLILPYTYPLEIGDLPKPITLDSEGNIISIDEPTGPIMICGRVNIVKRIKPICADSSGIWYSIDGELWTSILNDTNFFELDEIINENESILTDIPDCIATLDEHYFSFNNLLQITSTRKDDDLVNLLLYMPKTNEQKFANKITNIHPLGEDIMGIFTNNEIWYIQRTVYNDTVMYMKAIKSKIPIGCKAGNDIITALDGQAIIFATPRGLTAMVPQDFVATTEKTLSYLSDIIQEKYYQFYNNSVNNYSANIKIITYKYYILLYKYMNREILAFDTRDNTWWSWETPYPIKSLIADTRLRAILQIDYISATLLGVPFIFADKEVTNIGYYDDIIVKTLNGDNILVFRNETEGYKSIIVYATSIIDWYFISQKLHFDQINNYKTIESINTNLVGVNNIITKLSTKIYRDSYHPENAIVTEIAINDLCTFVKRVNFMHVINFQYRFENDKAPDKTLQQQLKLNSLCIRYSVKEGVR